MTPTHQQLLRSALRWNEDVLPTPYRAAVIAANAATAPQACFGDFAQFGFTQYDGVLVKTIVDGPVLATCVVLVEHYYYVSHVWIGRKLLSLHHEHIEPLMLNTFGQPTVLVDNLRSVIFQARHIWPGRWADGTAPEGNMDVTPDLYRTCACGDRERCVLCEGLKYAPEDLEE